MIIVLFIITIIVILLSLSLGEYARKTSTLQSFKNVEPKSASFSLTTIPSRMEHIEPCIKSLIKQSPKTVYLNVPYALTKTGEPYKVPKWMEEYVRSGALTIIRTTDKGPATKFLGLLETYIDPEHYIIVVDDDQVYNDKLLSNMVHRADELGGNVVLTANMDFGRLTGYSGYIFKRRLLDGIEDFKMPKECYLVDDVWITYFFKNKGIEMQQLFPMHVHNVSITPSPNNIIDFFRNLVISNVNLEKGSYREKVQEINPLYASRGNKNSQCAIALNELYPYPLGTPS